MTCRIHGILAIGVIRPYGIRQELGLAIGRPVGETTTMGKVRIAYFLKEDDIGVELADQFALLV